jgi:hypothetical protein
MINMLTLAQSGQRQENALQLKCQGRTAIPGPFTLVSRSSDNDQQLETDIMDQDDRLPHNPPMPETTKKATKRKKYPKSPSMRQPNQIGMIYAIGTYAKIADEATEKRLNTLGPSTSTRLAGYNYIWGETDKRAHPCP